AAVRSAPPPLAAALARRAHGLALAAAAMAGLAALEVLDADLLLHARRDLLERERQADLQVVAAPRPRAPPAARAAAAAAEQVVERALAAEVAHERAQRVGQVEAGVEATAAAAKAAARAAAGLRVAELVVARALLRVVQHLVRLGGFLELGLGLLVARVAVRMPLHGELAVGLLDVVHGSAARHAQHLVVIALRHASAFRARDHDAGRAQRAAVAGIALEHLLRDLARPDALGRRHLEQGFVERGVEALAHGGDRRHAAARERIAQALRGERHALRPRRGARLLRHGGERPLEVVQDFDQVEQDAVLARAHGLLAVALGAAAHVLDLGLGAQPAVLVVRLLWAREALGAHRAGHERIHAAGGLAGRGHALAARFGRGRGGLAVPGRAGHGVTNVIGHRKRPR